MADSVITFKILTIGESGVGKTCILRRFVENKFLKNHLATIGIDFKTKNIALGDKTVKLKIWDTAGQERFRNITNQYYKGADGIILVFDVTNKDSFDKIGDWMSQIQGNTSENEISIVLLGNKIDMEPRVITPEMGSILASKLGIKYFETSAFSGTNINESITFLSKDILGKKKGDLIASANQHEYTGGVSINENKDKKQEKKKKDCC